MVQNAIGLTMIKEQQQNGIDKTAWELDWHKGKLIEYQGNNGVKTNPQDTLGEESL